MSEQIATPEWRWSLIEKRMIDPMSSGLSIALIVIGAICIGCLVLMSG